MKKAFLGVVVLTVIAAGAFAAETATQAIEKRTGEFVAAWNHHDPSAMAAVWAPDGDLMNPFGRWAKGREGVAKLLTEEHSTMMKATTFTTNAIAVRILAPNVALADWDFTVAGITAPDGSTVPTQKLHGANVWVKTGGTWFLLAGRPMIPASLPGQMPR
ncbi:MAG TPA: SgcJ/EcaC family oxidoreductase [Thermoanaerobaculaceae bacterium]|nr:SgcJ/EcaC family oxidoreductase [Thermoanaerobaculaceae bacterium]